MEEILKALAPFPLLEGVVLGIMVAAAGFWAMRRGLQESRRRETASGEALAVRLELADDERRAQWEAHKHLDHIHENSFAIVKHLEKLVELQLTSIAALNRIADARWNKHQ